MCFIGVIYLNQYLLDVVVVYYAFLRTFVAIQAVKQANKKEESNLFQLVDEMISGEPLQEGEVRQLRRVCPGTVSHTGAPQGLQSLICCAKKIYNVNVQERLKKDTFDTSETDQFRSGLTVGKISLLAKNTIIQNTRNSQVWGD